jgi:hypothetical protein
VNIRDITGALLDIVSMTDQNSITIPIDPVLLEAGSSDEERPWKVINVPTVDSYVLKTATYVN